MLKQYFAIHVENSDGEQVKILTIANADAGGGSGSYTWSLADLPIGTYTLTETGYNLEHHSDSATVRVNGGTAVAGTSASATVAADKTAAVAFTNTYEYSDRVIVDIPVSKTVKQTGDVAPAEETFLFNVVVKWKAGASEPSDLYMLMAEKEAYAASKTSAGADYSFTLTSNSSGHLAVSGTAHDFENIESVTITEVNTGAANWTYDNTVYTVTFGYDSADDNWYELIAQDNGEPVSNQGDNKAAAAFTNTYTKELETLVIPVTKRVETTGNVNIPAGTYSFGFTVKTGEAVLSDSFSMAVGSTEATAKSVPKSGKFTIKVKLNTAGAAASASTNVYVTGTAEDIAALKNTLTIRESISSVPEFWTYDTGVWTYGGEASVSGRTFTNTYDKVEVVIPGTKTITVASESHDLPAGTYSFDFTMQTVPAGGLEDVEIDFSKAVNIRDNGKGGFTVTAQVPKGGMTAGSSVSVAGPVYLIGTAEDFAQLGTLYIREDASNVPDYWTYHSKAWVVEIEPGANGGWSNPQVTMTEEGAQSASDSIEFVNTYDDEIYTTSFTLTKNILGDALKEKETFTFRFALQGYSGYTGSWNGKEYDTFQVLVNGKALDVTDGSDTFQVTVPKGRKTASVTVVLKGSAKVFEEINEHYWITVQEVADTGAYNSWIYDDTLWRTYTRYTDKQGWYLNTRTATFTNQLQLTEVEIPVVKTMSEDSDPLLVDTDFTFRLGGYENANTSDYFEIKVDGKSLPADGEFTVTIPAGETTAKTSIVVTGTKADLKAVSTKLTVEELGEDDATWIYDKTVWDVIIAVQDATIKLKKQGAPLENLFEEYTEVAFENTYIEPLYSVIIPVEKKVTSDVALGERTFDFNLEATYVPGTTRTDSFSISRGNTFGIPVEVTDGTSQAKTTVTVRGTKADLASVQSIRISEIVPGNLASGWDYDETQYTVSLDYEADTDRWSAVTKIDGVIFANVIFENEYVQPRGDLTITKDFNISDDQGNALAEEEINALVENILSDTYTIHLLEKDGSDYVELETLTFADGTYADGDGDGDYGITWTVKDLPYGDYTVSEAGLMINHYDLTGVDIAYNGEALTGISFAEHIHGADFSFKEGEAAVLALVNTYAQNNDMHVIDLDLNKIVAQGGDVTPEGDMYFDLDVTLNWIDPKGATDIAVVFDGAANSMDDATYIHTNGVGTFEGGIELSGHSLDFANLESVIIREVIPNETGYWSYDETVWEVVGDIRVHPYAYEIYQIVDGKRVDVDADAVSFTNTYSENLHEVSFTVKKTVTGDVLPVDKMFHFIIGATDVSNRSSYFSYSYVGENVVDGAAYGNTGIFLTIPSGETDGECIVTFKGRASDLEALFPLVVRESNTGDPTVKYDDAEWNVNLVKTNAGYDVKIPTGILNLGNADAVAFVNEYDEPVYTMTIPVTKKITGDSVGKKMTFTFHVAAYWQDFDGMSAEDLSKDFSIRFQGENVEALNESTFTLTVPARTKTAEASVVITGTAKDLSEILYGLYISEDGTDVPKYWTYDQSMWWITPGEQGADGIWNVVITDSAQQTADGVAFVNEYDPPNAPKTGDESRLALWSLMMAVSAAALGVVLTVSRKRRQNG